MEVSAVKSDVLQEGAALKRVVLHSGECNLQILEVCAFLKY